MKTQKADDLRTSEVSALQEKLLATKDAYFQKKLQHSIGKLENPASVKLAKREIARIKTVITEKVKGIR